jgi:hypothetical protein
MTSPTKERFRLPDRVHARRFDGEVVVLDLGAGRYFSLDEVGATIWDLFAAGKTQAEVVQELVASFQVDEPTARSDVQRLSEELVAAGLLERGE